MDHYYPHSRRRGDWMRRDHKLREPALQPPVDKTQILILKEAFIYKLHY
jgi:hypothetical protein